MENLNRTYHITDILLNLWPNIFSIPFVGFAHISYVWFTATTCRSERPTRIQEPLALGGVEYREIYIGKQLAADNGGKQVSGRPV
jgi:hypothetical protein